MIKVNVLTNNTSWYKYIKNPNNYISKKINKINSKSKKQKKVDIYCTLLLSNDQEIKKLNKKFRKKNKSTDVLSFPFYKKKELQKRLIKEKEVYLGDIIININKVCKKKQLENFKTKFDNLWIHGLIHLFGFSHKTEKDYLEMRTIEKKYLNYING